MIAPLSEADLARLAGLGRVDKVPRRKAVTFGGPAVVIALDGYFRIFRHAAFVRDVSLGVAARGDVLTAGAVLDGRAAESGAEALGPGSVLSLSPDCWSAEAVAHPELSLALALSLGRRTMELEQRLEELSRSGVEARVASVLSSLAEAFATRLPQSELRLDLPLSQDDLARLAGTTRETCCSVVAAFGREGLVRGRRLRGLIIADQARLRGLAGRF